MKESIGKAIKNLRESAGLSQYRVSIITGISQQHISRIENGINSPGIEVLFSIAMALSVTVDDIMREAGFVPGEMTGTDAGQIYQTYIQLDEDERRRVSDFIRWRLSEQRARYKSNPDQG